MQRRKARPNAKHVSIREEIISIPRGGERKKAILSLTYHKIENPGLFPNIFQPGDYVCEIHVSAAGNQPRSVLVAIKEAEKKFEDNKFLKGIISFTSNKTLINYVKKRFGEKAVILPMTRKEKAILLYDLLTTWEFNPLRLKDWRKIAIRF